MNPHLAAPLSWFGDAPAPGRVGVVLLHGRTQTPAAMKALLVDRLALRNVSYAAPAAADHTWYPRGFLAPREENEPSLGHALEAVRATSDALSAEGLPLHRQVLLGFSQGACLAAEYLQHTRLRPAGLLALTGGFLGPQGTGWTVAPATWSGLPVVLGGSADDPWVPAWRMRETAQVFSAAGAAVEFTLFPGNEHGVPDAQLAAVRAVLVQLGAYPSALEHEVPLERPAGLGLPEVADE